MGRPKIGTCPACGTYGNLSVHHVIPKRFGGGSGPLERICRPCHDELERYIPKKEQMPPDFYPMVFKWFCERE